MKFVAGLLLIVLNIDCFSQKLEWELRIPPKARNINDVEFFANGNILLFGGNPSNDSIQHINFSENGGKEWNIILDKPFLPMINDAYFIQPKIGIAVGDNGSIISTTDGGKNWTKNKFMAAASGFNFSSIFFTNEKIGYITGKSSHKDSGMILKTIDQGKTWSVLFQINKKLNSIYFTDNDNGTCVGDSNTILTTNNGGKSWTHTSPPNLNNKKNFNTVYFINKTLGFIVGGIPNNDSIQTLLKTIDGGKNWTIKINKISPILQDVSFYDENNGIAVGNNGSAISTTDAGETWKKINLQGVNDKWYFTSVTYSSSKNAVIGGLQGAVFIAYDSAFFSTELKEHSTKSPFSIFPNPCKSHLKINASVPFNKNTITIYAMNGQLIENNLMCNNNLEIDISHIKNTQFYIKLTDKNGNYYYHHIIKTN